MKLRFSVDALHVLEQVAQEAEAPGIVFGCSLMHALLQKVASRAIEVGDRELLEHMERMCLVEREKK